MFPKILIKRIIIRLNIRNSVLELILKTFQLFHPKFSSINILYDRENRLTRPIMINFNFFVARNYIMRILLLYENRETCLRIVSAQLWMAFWSSYSISARHITRFKNAVSCIRRVNRFRLMKDMPRRIDPECSIVFCIRVT